MWIAIINLLFGVGLAAVPALIRKVFLTLGVGFVVYEGGQILLDTIKTYILSSFAQMNGFALASNIAGILNVDIAVTNILSALAIRFLWDSAKSRFLSFNS